MRNRGDARHGHSLTAFIPAFSDLDRRSKRSIRIGADLGMVVVCFVLAMALRLETLGFAGDPRVRFALVPAALAALAAFAGLGLCRVVVRSIGAEALQIAMIGVGVSALVLALAARVLAAPIPGRCR